MFKEFMVQVDESTPCEERLKLSFKLAQRHGARLTGIFAQLDPKRRNLIGGGNSGDFENACNVAKGLFQSHAKDSGVETRWIGLSQGKRDFVVREAVRCARFFDLSILAQPDHDGSDNLPVELPEQLLMHSGSPALIVPYAGTFDGMGKKVLLAWNGSAEAARAVRDALPLLCAAEEVIVVALSDHAAVESDTPFLSIIDRLQAYGVNCRCEAFNPGDSHTMDILLSTAADEDCDLIVMGAFGHYGFPKFHRGEGTRYMLQHITVPVFMAH